MSYTISHLSGLEILDSRGRPTVLATCRLGSGALGRASVPSGASRGAAEAWELRDGDPARHRGLGCLRAAAQIGGTIAAAAHGRAFAGQADLDQFLVALDGTPNKARLGANATLAISLAFARACAAEAGLPLYRYLAAQLAPANDPPMAGGQQPAAPQSPKPDTAFEQARLAMPRPMINLFSGGKHAGGQVPIQDLLIIPMAETMADLLAQAAAVYQAAADLTLERYGMRLLRADEGGLAPPFPSIEAMFADAQEAVRRAGLRPGDDIRFAVDIAASHFYDGAGYDLGAGRISGAALVDQLERWATDFELASIEDGLAEEDWAAWAQLCARLGAGTQIVGDDLLCTNPARITRAIGAGAANALLLKVNQIGTLSEALAANQLARAAGWRVVVSARSGETEDDWLADLAVGWRADQIKVGSVTQSERLAKYNRLLEIERAWAAR